MYFSKVTECAEHLAMETGDKLTYSYI